MVERVHALTDRARSWQETTELVDMLNRVLKLYIYGYLNRVRSSRRLEAECCCSTAFLVQGLQSCDEWSGWSRPGAQ
jgi:hypothetical protein